MRLKKKKKKNKMNYLPANKYRNFFLLLIFGIAMGFLEAIVVVYLRELYYPKGFTFPLSQIPPFILKVELLREATTIIMLLAIGSIAGRNFLQRFAYFIYSFGIWDIFYYVALKLILDWPPSLLTWDILFLIPVTWIGPVLAPVICSLTMILFAVSIVNLQERGYIINLHLTEWGFILFGAFIIFCTFVWDISKIIVQGGFFSEIWTLVENGRFQEVISHYTPIYFNWYLFVVGEIFILCSLVLIFRRKKTNLYIISKQKY